MKILTLALWIGSEAIVMIAIAYGMEKLLSRVSVDVAVAGRRPTRGSVSAHT